MESQFNNENVDEFPKYDTKYHCSHRETSEGFTILMKWVLMTRSNSTLLERIKQFIKLFPKEINAQNKKGWTPLMLKIKKVGHH